MRRRAVVVVAAEPRARASSRSTKSRRSSREVSFLKFICTRSTRYSNNTPSGPTQSRKSGNATSPGMRNCRRSPKTSGYVTSVDGSHRVRLAFSAVQRTTTSCRGACWGRASALYSSDNQRAAWPDDQHPILLVCTCSYFCTMILVVRV